MQVVFVLATDAKAAQYHESVFGADVRLFPNERQLLKAWQAFVWEQDVDAFAVFEASFYFDSCCVMLSSLWGQLMLTCVSVAARCLVVFILLMTSISFIPLDARDLMVSHHSIKSMSAGS